MLSDFDEFLKHRALAASPSEELIGLIRSTRQGTCERAEAAMILGYRRSPEAIPALLGMVRDGWYTESVAAAEALAKIGGSELIPHIAQAYEECKTICKGTHLHFDAKRLWGVLRAFLRLWNEAELKLLLREGDRLEGWSAWGELEVRRATRRLRELLTQREDMMHAVVELREIGEVQHWTVPYAVEAITGLPSEDARYLIFCAVRLRLRSRPC